MSEVLAIAGGRPVREVFLPYGRQNIDEDDISAVVHVLRSEWLTTGPNVSDFERAFAKLVGARFAVAVSSGTAALHAATFAVGIGAGDEVVTTPLTFAATANCVLYQGGRPIFADVKRDTLNIDPLRVEAALSDRTKAVITVDFTGLPSDLDELRHIAQAHDLKLIEDASHALGGNYRGRPIGSLADLTTFSLHPVKHVTTGEGGMVTTNDEKLARRVRLFRSHGISTDHAARERAGTWFYEMKELGYNYRITDFQCALGLSQLAKLSSFVSRRNQIAQRYTTVFSDFSEIDVPPQLSDRCSAWHLYVIRLRLDRLKVGRKEIFEALRAENIGVNVHYIPVPWHPYYSTLGYSRGGWPVAENAYERILSLPLFSAMSDQDIKDVISAMAKVITHYRQ